MKVLLINGSPNEFGCTNMALSIVASELKAQDVDSEIIWLGQDAINDYALKKQEIDIVDKVGEMCKSIDGIIVGSPTYYAHPTGRLLCFLDRLSIKYGPYLEHKPATSIMTARRAGQVIGNDIILKHFANNNMPIVTSTYWNLVFASKPEEMMLDEEGVLTLKNISRNMAWLLKSIEAGKKEGVVVPSCPKCKTNFTR